jgi:hypothetical protein
VPRKNQQHHPRPTGPDRIEVPVGDPRSHAKLVNLRGTKQADGSLVLANGIRVKP